MYLKCALWKCIFKNKYWIRTRYWQILNIRWLRLGAKKLGWGIPSIFSKLRWHYKDTQQVKYCISWREIKEAALSILKEAMILVLNRSADWRYFVSGLAIRPYVLSSHFHQRGTQPSHDHLQRISPNLVEIFSWIQGCTDLTVVVKG